MTFQELVLHLCEQEGLKEEVNVAQMSEIVKIVLKTFRNLPPEEVTKLIGEVND